MPKLIFAAQTIAIVALASVSTSIPSTSALTVPEIGVLSQRSEVIDAKPSLNAWQRRHGDHEDQEEEGEHHLESQMSHIMQESHHDMNEDTHAHSHSDSDSDSTSTSTSSHGGHMHSHGGPHPYDAIPEASKAGLALFSVPQLPHGAGGHNHGHGGEPPKMELNETVIVRGKGPDPLSYIEWDFNYGIGKSDQLKRFANAYNDQEAQWKDLMGVAGGRYRHLVDEKDSEMRKSVIMDIQSRVSANPDYVGRHRSLLILHVLGCILSCFILLPATLALRAASSNLAPLASLVYLVTLAGSLFLSILYKAMTPRLYPSNSHSGLGYAIFWLSLLALGGDVFRLIKQVYTTIRSIRASSPQNSMRIILNSLSLSNRGNSPHEDEYDPLEEERMLSDDGSGISDARELDLERMQKQARRQGSSGSSGSSSPLRSVHFEGEDDHVARGNNRRSRTRSWTRDLPSPSSTLLNTPRTSVLDELPGVSWKLGNESENVPSNVPAWRQNNEDSFHHNAIQTPKKRFALLRSILRYSHVTLARSIPVLSFAAAYTGLAVYTGSCRGNYKNVCLAHGIKGGIFFWYGLLSFGRYMGAYADMGWAWNRKPMTKRGRKGNQITAEWVESCVIFIYGATNTWMERFDAKPGDPYTVKQVQHISIAIMFWFAGLMGMILEWGSLKNLLAFPVSLKQATVSRHSSRNQRALSALSADEIVTVNPAPPSYNFSFNPFPALVIGVTGVAMAAHHQDYVYEVSIHALWGNLLAGFSGLRFMTYFFLWLRPPTSSIMPSRPPTEALASFSLACGGLVFMLSSEEVSFVAMRNGFGDFMMILNVTVAIVALLFCWIAGLMILKAWALKREHIRHLSNDSIRLEDTNIHQNDHSNPTNLTDQNTFVIGTGDEEEELARTQDEKRQLATSPEQV